MINNVARYGIPQVLIWGGLLVGHNLIGIALAFLFIFALIAVEGGIPALKRRKEKALAAKEAEQFRMTHEIRATETEIYGHALSRCECAVHKDENDRAVASLERALAPKPQTGYVRQVEGYSFNDYHRKVENDLNERIERSHRKVYQNMADRLREMDEKAGYWRNYE